MEKSLIDHSFLEVTINSNRLMTMLNNIAKQISEHSAQIKILKDIIPTIKQSAQNCVDMSEARVFLQQKKLEKKLMAIEEEFREQKVQKGKEILKSHKQLGEEQKKQLKRICMLEEGLKRANQIRKQFQERQIQKQNETNHLIAETKDQIGYFTQKVSTIESKFDDQFEMVLIKVQSILHESQIKNSGGNRIQKFMNSQPLSKNENQGKKKATKSTIMNWAQYADKIGNIEKKMKEEESMNKVVYAGHPGNPGKKKMMECCEEKQNRILEEQSMMEHGSGQEFDIGVEFIKQVDLKLRESVLKINGHFEGIKGRLQILDEKTSINTRKIEKQSQKNAETRLLLKMHDEKRSEDQLIQILRGQMLQKNYEIDQQMDRKIGRETYDKDRQKIHQKILILQENLVDKADKGEMKKAFLFLEEKIKQIIILMAGEQGNQKDGALRKIPVKCLSCDKHVESESAQTSRATSPAPLRERDHTSRGISRNIRKRMNFVNI